MKVFVRILLFLLLVSATALADGRPSRGRHGRQSRSEDGMYRITLVGYFRGTGIARVAKEGVSIQAVVTTPRGVRGLFKAEKLAMDGPYFSGSGVAAGENITISGRLDAVKGSRLLATYSGTSTAFGRIIGVLPADGDKGPTTGK